MKVMTRVKRDKGHMKNLIIILIISCFWTTSSFSQVVDFYGLRAIEDSLSFVPLTNTVWKNHKGDYLQFTSRRQTYYNGKIYQVYFNNNPFELLLSNDLKEEIKFVLHVNADTVSSLVSNTDTLELIHKKCADFQDGVFMYASDEGSVRFIEIKKGYHREFNSEDKTLTWSKFNVKGNCHYSLELLSRNEAGLEYKTGDVLRIHIVRIVGNVFIYNSVFPDGKVMNRGNLIRIGDYFENGKSMTEGFGRINTNEPNK